MGYVCNRSLRPTPGCFLSPGPWKVRIMLAKGKAPKVLIAAATREPVAHLGEGSEPQGSVTRPVRVESHDPAGGKPAFTHRGCEVAAAIPPRPEGRGFSRRN